MNKGLLVICLLLPVLSPAQVSFENLHVDTTISGFHFAADFQGTHLYTPNGPSDLKSVNPSAFSFSIMRKANKEKALEQLGMYRRMSLSQGYEPNDVVEMDTTIAGLPVIGWSLRETLAGSEYENRVFEAFYVKDSTVVLFISGDLDHGKHIENFKRTFFNAVR